MKHVQVGGQTKQSDEENGALSEDAGEEAKEVLPM